MATNWTPLIGFDYFISYRRSEATPYARALEKSLTAADFRCFLDDKDLPAGKGLTLTLRWALKRTKVLIVLATPHVSESKWVGQEIEAFSKSKRDIVPISIQGGLEKAMEKDPQFKILRNLDLRWIDEDSAVGPEGAPSDHVIVELQNSFRHRRANRTLRLILTAVALILASVSAVAFWQKSVADREREVAIEAGKLAEAQKSLAQQRERDAIVARKAESGAKEEANAERDAAKRNERIANEQRGIAQQRLQVVQSQALAADARRVSSEELISSLSGAAAAFEVSPSIDAQTALLEGLTKAAKIKRFILCPSGHKGTGVAFSDSRAGLLAIACNRYPKTLLFVMRIDGNKPISRLEVPDDARYFAFIGPTRLALGGAKELRVFDFSRNTSQSFAGHQKNISAVATSRDGDKVATLDIGGEIRLWSRENDDSNAWTSTIVSHRSAGTVSQVKFLDQDRFLLLSPINHDSPPSWIPLHPSNNPGEARHMPANLPLPIPMYCREFPHGVRHLTYAFSDNGQMGAYNTESNQLIIYQGNNDGCLPPLIGHTHNFHMTFSHDSKLLASVGAIRDGDETHGVILWDLEQIHPLATQILARQQRSFNRPHLALSPNGVSWLCAGCGSGIVWDGHDTVLPHPHESAAISAAALSDDASESSIGLRSGDVLRIRKSGTKRFPRLETIGNTFARYLWYVGSNLYAITGDNGLLRWTGSSLTTKRNAPLKIQEGYCPDVSSTGAGMAIEGGESTRHVLMTQWETASRQPSMLALSSHADSCASLAFSAGAQLGVRTSAGHSPLTLFSVEGDKLNAASWINPARAPSGLTTMLSPIRLSASGDKLLAVSDRSDLVLLDLRARRVIGKWPAENTESIALSARGNLALSISDTRLIRWELDPFRWMQMAKDMIVHLDPTDSK